MVWFLHDSWQRSSQGSHPLRKALCPLFRGSAIGQKKLINAADDSMFSHVMNNVNHILHQLITPRRNTCYDLWSRHDDCLLTHKPNSTVESDFVNRRTHIDMLTFTSHYCNCSLVFCQVLINKYDNSAWLGSNVQADWALTVNLLKQQ